MKSKKKNIFPSYYPLLFVVLIFIIAAFFIFGDKRALNIGALQIPLKGINVDQGIQIEGLLNSDEVNSSEFDTQLLRHPPFNTVVQEAKIEHYDTQENFAFNELDKQPFYCLSNGDIKNESITFYVGSSQYKNQNTKLLIDSSYFLKNIQLPNKANSQGGKLIFCWKETNSAITLNKPDFGLVYWTEAIDEKLRSQVIFFSGREKILISSGYFKNVVPLYLTSDSFLAVFEAYGGGWDDTEVISFNVTNLSFQNEDNCASLFPRDSSTLTFDPKCSAGIEGTAQDSVGDYGFQRN